MLWLAGLSSPRIGRPAETRRSGYSDRAGHQNVGGEGWRSSILRTCRLRPVQQDASQHSLRTAPGCTGQRSSNPTTSSLSGGSAALPLRVEFGQIMVTCLPCQIFVQRISLAGIHPCWHSAPALPSFPPGGRTELHCRSWRRRPRAQRDGTQMTERPPLPGRP